jgi:hypothetical protein
MSFNASDYLEDKWRGHLLRGQIFTPSGILAIALTHDIPTDASTGASMGEVSNAGSYSRVSITSNTSNWSADNTTDGNSYNSNVITFPQATADWGWVSGFALCDTSVYGAGNVYVWGALTVPQFVQNTNIFQVQVSGLQIQFQ